MSRVPGRCARFWPGFLVASLAASGVQAEDEVRIALDQGLSSVELRGTKLALFDGDDGHRIWAFAERGTFVLRPRSGSVEASGAGQARGRRYGAAKRLFAEAEREVEVGSGLYYGRIEIRVKDNGLVVLNRLPLETYLLGIVGSEMPSSWPAEALKAQAVAARTYALQRVMMARSANQAHDLADTVISQVYRGAANIAPSVIKAVKSTEGEVLAHNRMLVEALFHSTCGGSTLSSKAYFGGERAYLVARGCTWCKDSNRYRWKVRFPLGEVEKSLLKSKLIRRPLRSVKGKGAQLEVLHGPGKSKISARKIRRSIGWARIYSERFEVNTSGGFVEFTGMGFGHGVGLCQWGARGMAEEGRNYRQILEYYYTGAQVRRIY